MLPPMTKPRNPSVQPYLAVRDAARALELYARVFGMTERYRLPMGDKIAHAELDYDGGRICIASEFPEEGVQGPASLGGTSVSLLLVVDDVDQTFARATQEGFTVEATPKDEFFGARVAKVEGAAAE